MISWRPLLAASIFCSALATSALDRAFAAATLDQGQNWTEATRRDFYSRDQGSRLMPLRWMVALKQASGEAFLADGLARYGYIASEASPFPGLPVGFVVAKEGDRDFVGLTCAACHTRQIEVEGRAYRIDGGPALADLHGLWADLDAAFGRVLADKAAFDDFAKAVLGADASPQAVAVLRGEATVWFDRFHAITQNGLPKDKPWGPGRADAVSMIFNRLSGLDVGPPPSRIIAGNFRMADAPVRYPFLWNAAIQDMTQWPGFAKNGDDLLGLARNLGEVIGVFGVFEPKKEGPFIIDFLDNASVNFRGLAQLESDIRKIGPPRWPWAIDTRLAAQGKQIFDKGCGPNCHEITDGQQRLLNRKTWRTPEQDIGTDGREYMVLSRTAETGVLEGAFIPALMRAPLKHDNEPIIGMLAASVFGSILQYPFERSRDLAPAIGEALRDGRLPIQPSDLGSPAIVIQQALKDAYDMRAAKPLQQADPCAGGGCKYEARVLEGIWATAPYLHNGSVPTLAELLKAPKDRIAEFKIGPKYDVDNLGLAADQTRFDFTLKTNGCEDRFSGVSRCGHDFGTSLTPDEKKALLEYLKML